MGEMGSYLNIQHFPIRLKPRSLRGKEKISITIMITSRSTIPLTPGAYGVRYLFVISC
jgi:hypothetical protein